jgi:uncharacterized protein YbjT (DUF2867 family)
MAGTVLIAGASGALGTETARQLAARGWRVRALARDPARLAPDVRGGAEVVVGDARDAAVVARAVAGVDAVFSCLGAPVLPALGLGWRGFGAVDWPLNRGLVDAARAAGVARFAYVSVFHTPALRRLAYVDAHERVVGHLRASGLPHAVIRPTGFFSALAAYVDLARKGPLPELGGGAARTNPIADADLAAVCADAVAADAPALELDVGGPEVLSRRAIAELAFAALGRPPRVRRLPVAPLRVAMTLARPFHPRISQFFAFVAAISTQDVIAPAHGARRLADAFEARARVTPSSPRQPAEHQAGAER